MLKSKLAAAVIPGLTASFSFISVGKDDSTETVAKKSVGMGKAGWNLASSLFKAPDAQSSQDRIDLTPILDSERIPDEYRDAYLDADVNNDGFLDVEESANLNLLLKKRNPALENARNAAEEKFRDAGNTKYNNWQAPNSERPVFNAATLVRKKPEANQPVMNPPWAYAQTQGRGGEKTPPKAYAAQESDEALWAELLAELAAYANLPEPPRSPHIVNDPCQSGRQPNFDYVHNGPKRGIGQQSGI